MYLVIAEKPELGQAIATAIPGTSNVDKAAQIIQKTWRGEPMTIVWCFGHLLTLVEPEEYDAKYCQWKLEDLPFYFENWKHKPIDESAKGKRSKAPRVAQIGKLLKEATTVIHAGDIDDEGQLLIDELLRYFNYRGKVLRLNTNDTSPTALRKALDNMDDNANHVSAGLAAFGRQLSDKTFGYNLTRYYSIINSNTLLPVGRVKMPTLGLVVQRDLLIENHKKSFYYTANATIRIDGKDVPARFIPAANDPHLLDGKIADRSYMESVATQLKGLHLPAVKVTVSEQLEQPPLPFNLVKLYSYCANKWGLQPGKVLQATQNLRDKYRAITYNRTNCQYLSSAMYNEAPNTVRHAAQNMGIAPEKFDTAIRSRCFNDEKISAHTAIIPTGTEQDISRFSPDEALVYKAITNYYLAQFLPPAVKIVTKLEAPAVNGGKLTATSTVISKPGYRALLGGEDFTRTEEDGPREEEDEANKETPLSLIAPGTYSGTIQNTAVQEKETRPLPRYTAHTLIADMTCIAKYVTNPAVKELLLKKDKGKGDEHGSIGTSATRETIVKELIDRGYLREEKKGKSTQLISTQLGRDFYNILPDSVRKADVSAKWWCEQESIREGQMTPDAMAKSVLRTVAAIVQSKQGVMDKAAQYAKGIVDGEPLGKCPKCGGNVYETAKGFKCEKDDCKFFIYRQDKFFASLGKQLTAKAVQIMLKTNRLTVKNCKSKKGNTFDAVIVCDFTSGDYPQYTFAQDEELEAIGKCPKCGSAVVEKNKSFSCVGESCKFILWKSNGLLESMGKRGLTAANAKDILQTGRCKLTGCKSTKNPGKTYSCFYVVNFSTEPCEIKREFPSR